MTLLAIKLPTATRRIQFCAGHRVLGHESKCAHLHGHNYVVFATARVRPAVAETVLATVMKSNPEDPASAFLDGIGRVVDFSVLKDRIGGWIEANWDHGFILCAADQAMHRVMEQASRANPLIGQRLHIMPTNPTAENMARYLLTEVGPQQLAGMDVELCHVRVWETENCYADAALADHGLVAPSL